MAASEHSGNGSHCYHCDLPIPAGAHWPVVIDGVTRPMCCPGCQAVASAIISGGLNDFYRLRSEPAQRPDDTPPDLDIYAIADVAARYVTSTGDGLGEASLLVSGITCGACVWLIEKALRRVNGVHNVHVNLANHRAQVTFDTNVTSLKDILQIIREIGYSAAPYDRTRQEHALAAERKQQLKRLGVAGLLGMQIMMLATALYFGEHSGMDPLYQAVLRWTSLLLAVPVVLYSAAPFFRKAWLNLRRGRAGMDLPVSLGIGVAFAGSLIATWSGHGAVYFESVAMFVFFLLGARYLEFMARQRANQTLDGLAQARPLSALRLAADGSYETVVADSLVQGDRVLVRPGDSFPADGVVTSGTTTVDESLLSGESLPQTRDQGTEVIGGSINIDGSVEVEVTRTGERATLSQILRLAEQANSYKPRAALLADRVAHWFVLTVLVLASATAAYWWLHAPGRWWQITVAVLVVTCPCALSLATPTALVAAIGALTRSGLVAVSGNALEKLSQVSHIVFDKTGTLTAGHFSVQQVLVHGELSADQCLAIAAALEQHSNHPIAQAILQHVQDQNLPSAEKVDTVVGAGVAGTIDSARYFLGHSAWIQDQLGFADLPATESEQTLVYLADARGFLATVVLDDPVRADSAGLVAALQQRGYQVSVCSGDRAVVVARVAKQLGIIEYRAEQKPDDKLAYVRGLQGDGASVLAVGDGVNDAPVLAAADTSIAIGQGAPLAQQQAEWVLLGERLHTIANGLSTAGRTMRVIKQNLLWAAAYNLCALPAAMLGWVPPWLAALGMSLSSVIVVANAARLSRRADDHDLQQLQQSTRMAAFMPVIS